jgi:hypothetical protein
MPAAIAGVQHQRVVPLYEVVIGEVQLDGNLKVFQQLLLDANAYGH